MIPYRAPLRDMRFVLEELPGFDRIRELPGGEVCSPDLVASILEQAARLATEVLDPLNRSGDEQGCALENGAVRTPEGFPAAYATYAAGGWSGLACDPRYGGQGLPQALRVLAEEMIAGANLAFCSYTSLVHGAYITLHANASEELKAFYLPRLVDGSWMATMCLTEADSGSDLNLVRAIAVPGADRSHRISGTKVFVSAGEHDLSENIVHLVLARLPEAPSGTRGISLFVVPKLLPDEAGRPGRANGLACRALERKMGQNGAATCVLEFDQAIGWLVGEPHRGLAAMFQMMNTARLGAALQGLGIAEAAYRRASAYAAERLQGRAPSGPRRPDLPADPIVVHPDVRRMLLTMRAHVEGMRALIQWVAQALDRRAHDPDPAEREAAERLVALMTPVVKALCSDLGSECANLGIQVLGGHGYIRDNAVEQHVRDVRIAQIYDGTNGIQAFDLVVRKVGRAGLAPVFARAVENFVEAQRDRPDMTEFVQPLAAALARLKQVTAWIEAVLVDRPDEAAAAASDYLRLTGRVALAFMWARMAAVALPKANDPEAAFYQAKLLTARFHMQRLLPEAEALTKVILGGAEPLLAFEEAAFARP